MMRPEIFGFFAFLVPLFIFILWISVVVYVLVLLTRMTKSLERIADKIEHLESKKLNES